MRRTKNWDRIRKLKPQETLEKRDVYEDQQLERGTLPEKRPFFPYVIASVFLALVCAGLIYCVLSVGGYISAMFSHVAGNAGADLTSGAQGNLQPGDTDVSAGTDTGGFVAGEEGAVTFDENGMPVYDFDKLDRFEQGDGGGGISNEGGGADASADGSGNVSGNAGGTPSIRSYFAPTPNKLFWTALLSALIFGLILEKMYRNWVSQNIQYDHTDINHNHNDAHIALPEEVQRKFDWFPDAGAHSSVQVSSMISHVAVLNKGIKTIHMAKRYTDNMVDGDGNVVFYKGEIEWDEDGEPVLKRAPLFDLPFMKELFKASNLHEKYLWKFYDLTKIPYNGDGRNRDKLGKYNTVADMINADWEFPAYEPQRPGGCYLVDTAPVNTMVLAITRAGKGQTVIEPTIDMWTREKKLNNIVINDPKGELLRMYYVRMSVRGYQIVQFNLINAIKTDIYNPLALAGQAAREGDFVRCASYIENIAEVFFPLDGSEDPMWPTAANNAFKRAAYGLIDYFLEEEKELRLYAERTDMDAKILENKVDMLWGKVTLYNCYQLFVQLSSKKRKNPSLEFSNYVKNDDVVGLRKLCKMFYIDIPEDVETLMPPQLDDNGNIVEDNLVRLDDDQYNEIFNVIEYVSTAVWEGKPEHDLLTLYFNATDLLPKNSMRRLVSDTNNSLRAMGGAEKMMASCEMQLLEKRGRRAA